MKSIAKSTVTCNVCSQPLIQRIYASDSADSITSLCMVIPTRTEVYFCADCAHIQSGEIDNVEEFYDKEYEILTSSEEEDQIYEIKDGKKIFRTEHQANSLMSKLDLQRFPKVLDFGCAKSSMGKELIHRKVPCDIHLFDVSDRYVTFWKKFLKEDHYAIYELPKAWQANFDLVTSFFALEHIVDLDKSLSSIHWLLKTGGEFYGIIPNVMTNFADLIVVDHVNHFTHSSLDRLFRNAGFTDIRIDDQTHRGAFIVQAVKTADIRPTAVRQASAEAASQFAAAKEVAQYWLALDEKLKALEGSGKLHNDFAIYGAGFYGNFIWSRLNKKNHLRFFVDQNPFLQGKNNQGLPVISPDQLPHEIKTVVVGLNPKFSKEIIEQIEAFRGLNTEFIML